MDAIQDIKSRLSIVDVVEKYVPLKKAGRNLKGLCPFHNDHAPSLLVSPEKGLAWCFACQNGGDMFAFVEKIEHVDFSEALKILANMAGIQLTSYSTKKSESPDQKIRMLSLLEETQNFFRENYQKNVRVQEEVAKRNISEAVLTKFGIGYAKDDFHALEKYLLSKNYSHKEMLEVGVVSQKDDTPGEVYDRFRKRITFPIFDLHGSLVGFGGRIFEKGDPKYLNSPETELYKKSSLLYGMNFAREAIKKTDFCLVVEGYYDVIACHNAGIENTVAVSGVALSEEHVKIIHRFTKNIVFAFDADSAGVAATKRGIQTAIQGGSHIFILEIPDGKDPDEALRNAPEKFISALGQRKPVMEYLFEKNFEGKNTENVEDQKNILEEFFSFIVLFPSEIEKNFYLKRLAERLQTSELILQKEYGKFAKSPLERRWKEKNPSSDEEEILSHEKVSPFSYLVGAICAFPELFPIIRDRLLIGLIGENSLEKRFYNSLEEEYNVSGVLDPEKLVRKLPQDEAKKIELITLFFEGQNDHLPEESREETVRKIVKTLNKSLIVNEQRKAAQMLKQASKGSTLEKELLKKLHDLTRLVARF
ncbi:DNA primase [Candidatus Peregrinibacteria bacterium]|nr:DNA primase [Candidatus Peregrinibacteria bacterium]